MLIAITLYQSNGPIIVFGTGAAQLQYVAGYLVVPHPQGTSFARNSSRGWPKPFGERAFRTHELSDALGRQCTPSARNFVNEAALFVRTDNFRQIISVGGAFAVFLYDLHAVSEGMPGDAPVKRRTSISYCSATAIN